MIHVQMQREPPDFDTKVRQPGKRALLELAGGLPAVKRPGPKRKPSGRPEDLPPYWRACLAELHRSYRGICAYVCIYIPKVVGSAGVDHMVPKSADPKLAYEWSNYRLACGMMNGKKGIFEDVLDPFEIETGWFALELAGCSIHPAPGLGKRRHRAVKRTIERVGLDLPECREIRSKFVNDYINRDISFRYLEGHCPFVALEMRRQGLIRPEDLP